MPIIRIDNVGTLGIVKDQTPWELPPEAWTDGCNVRFSPRYVERIMGHKAAFNCKLDSGTGISPVMLFNDKWSTYYYWYLICTGSSAGDLITAYDGGSTYKDITRSGGMTIAWPGFNMTMIGGVPIFNPGYSDYPVYWGHGFATPTLSQNLTWSTTAGTTWANAALGGGTGVRAAVIRSFKQHLIALRPSYPQSASPVEYPHTVLWSHPADPGTIPPSWDYADTTVDAGRSELPDTGGYIVDCLPMRDVNMVYKTDAIYTMQYAGAPFIFNFEKLSTMIGMIAPHCCVEVQGRHFVVGFDDIYLHDGIKIESIVSDRNRKAILGSIDDTGYKLSFCVLNVRYDEVWFCYPEPGQTYCNRVAIWNYRANTWTFRELPQAYWIARGPYDPASAGISTDTWNSATGSWDTDPQLWDEQGYAAVRDKMMMCAPGLTTAFEMDKEFAFGATTPTAYIERIGLAMIGRDRSGAPRTDPTVRKTVRHLWPRIDGVDGCTVNIYIGSQQHVDDAIAWKGPYPFTVGTSDRIDCLVQGRLIGVKFEATSNLAWRLEGYSMDLDVAARYT